MPRLVRRKPLWERITAMLNPMDFLLWLSEEMETREWDSKLAGTQLGLGLNFVFLLAQANAASSRPADDVFSDDDSSSWLALCIYPLIWGMAAFSLTNAVYTMSRTRKYRMFEANIDVQLSTPSARRVRVEPSPISSSPFQFIADMVTPESAESRAHPDKRRDVWELAVWDPIPISLRLFCFFSPGHVLAYFLFLPLTPLDPRPSVTVFNILLVQVALSAQLLLLSSRFSQQAKDSAVIQKEVMHEYDKKFVHPRLHPVVRDAGTQMSEDQPPSAREFVQVGTPTTLIKRTFVAHDNPHFQPDKSTASHSNVMRPQMFTPQQPASRYSDSFTSTFSQEKAAFRNTLPIAHTPISRSTSATVANNTPSREVSVGQGGGGYMGIHSHSLSPLKKTISLGDMHNTDRPSPRNSKEMAAYEQAAQRRPSSPIKRSDGRLSLGLPSSQSTNSFPNSARRVRPDPKERYPSRW